MEDAWANLQKDFCDILVDYFNCLFAWLSEVDTMKTRDARSYKAIISYWNWRWVFCLINLGIHFAAQWTCVLHSFLLIEAFGNEMLFNFSSPCMSSRKILLPFFFLFSLKFSSLLKSYVMWYKNILWIFIRAHNKWI